MSLPCDDDLHQHTTYRISLSLSDQTYPKAARLASLLPPSPLHTPPRIRGTADSQAADHVSCAATPARKRDTRLAVAGFRPPLLRYLKPSTSFARNTSANKRTQGFPYRGATELKPLCRSGCRGEVQVGPTGPTSIQAWTNYGTNPMLLSRCSFESMKEPVHTKALVLTPSHKKAYSNTPLVGSNSVRLRARPGRIWSNHPRHTHTHR